MPTLRTQPTYSVEQCQQMITRFTQELMDAIEEHIYGTSWYDSRDVARQALIAWQRHLKDALARQEIRRTKHNNGISGHYHD